MAHLRSGTGSLSQLDISSHAIGVLVLTSLAARAPEPFVAFGCSSAALEAL